MSIEGKSIIAIAPVHNEELKITDVVRRAVAVDEVDEVLVVDDGSADDSAQVAKDMGATVVPLGRLIGVGAAIRAGYEYAREHDYDIAVVMAGNNKDCPEEIPRLVDPIVRGTADFVQGSRWLDKANDEFGEMPTYRKLATRLHPRLFSLFACRRVTDSTNGFRALRTSLVDDPGIDLHQEWLDTYELEPYLYMRTIRLGYKTTEVPVTKIYPPKHLGQTKMKPIVDWWGILKPLFLVGLGIRK